MPKRNPDQTISIRIELQDSERELLRQYAAGETFGKIATGIDQLASFSNLYVIATFIEILTGKEILLGTPNDIGELLKWLKEGIEDFSLKELIFGDEEGEFNLRDIFDLW